MRVVRLVVVSVTALIIGATAAQALAKKVTHNPKGRFLGAVVPTKSPVLGPRAGAAPSPRTYDAMGFLDYHGGPVMNFNTTYAILWDSGGDPGGNSFDPGYQATLDQYFTDVSADSLAGGVDNHTNVYSTDEEYTDGGGNPATYNSTYGGSFIDSNPYPANGCTDPRGVNSICLSDAQIRAEVQNFASQNGLPTGDPNTLYFVFTPQGVSSCFGSDCSYVRFCAYHSWMPDNTLYTNQPYVTGLLGCDPGVNSGLPSQEPNGSSADVVINVVSHEHNEAITDPYGTGWWDTTQGLGGENGDKCNFHFGTISGDVSSGLGYNQTINGHNYLMQTEFSNLDWGNQTPPDPGCLQNETYF